MKTFADRLKINYGNIRRGPVSAVPLCASPRKGLLEIRQILRGPEVQTKLVISTPDDAYEREADQVAEAVLRMPDGAASSGPTGRGDDAVRAKPSGKAELPAGEISGEEEEKLVSLKMEEGREVPLSGKLSDRLKFLEGGGIPLGERERAFFEPRFGADFSQVRLHTDRQAAETAGMVNAHAFTYGNNVVFGTGRYDPVTESGKRLLAHELTHVVQQGESCCASGQSVEVASRNPVEVHPCGCDGGQAALQRSVVPTGGSETQPSEEGELPVREPAGPMAQTSVATIPSPETCPPPEGMRCLEATSSPGAVTNTLIFPSGSSTLNTAQEREIDAAAASWHASGGSVTVRIDGYASPEGNCEYNWDLSCRRAEAVAAELESPSDHSAGVPDSSVSVFAHGESDDAGPALAPNRRATISIPSAPPTPTPPAPPTCVLPVTLGRARGCAAGTDFTHFDFPSISTASEAKLAAWAAARPLSRGPLRSLVTNTECEMDMDRELLILGGGAGHAAFSRFVAGTGGTETHGPTSALGAMAWGSGSFRRTVAQVQRDIETQLAAQASSGALDPCALSVTPPATNFEFSDGAPLKAVIGGTQGEELIATGFSGNIPMRSYIIDLRFLICDDFGVDEADLYSPGLCAFWVLQHERSATLYAPFVNMLDLSVTVTGTF
ncbi:MAG: OmpA family protein [Syntrophus sp. PtaU1.Bin208]|nr:MAG: OmpA family protein [Syntrophus sp. PtaU1.Bin208]